MRKMRIITTRELVFAYICTLLKAWWKFHADMARYLYAHVKDKLKGMREIMKCVYEQFVQVFQSKQFPSYVRIARLGFTIEK